MALLLRLSPEGALKRMQIENRIKKNSHCLGNSRTQQSSMIAAYLNGARNIEIREEEIPEIDDSQVLVNIKSVGICGSDIHYYEKGRIGSFIASKPLILGHECAGEIKKVGSKVEGLKVGDRVALEPGVPCGRCEKCKRGRYNLCMEIYFMASAPCEHGAFREYIAHHGAFTYKLPDNISFDEGAMIEPLAAAIFAARRGEVKEGDKVAILGSGPIGILLMQVVKALGASKVIISDLNQSRLGLAERLGADRTVNVTQGKIGAAVNEETGGRGCEVVLDVAGTPETHQEALKVAGRGGTVVFVAWPPEPDVSLDVHKIGFWELCVKGMFRYCNVYPEAISLVSSGMVKVKDLITHHYHLKDVKEAIEFAARRQEGTIKVMVNT